MTSYSYTLVKPFDSYYTSAQGIGNNGEVVGDYFSKADDQEYGFSLLNGTYTQISVPGASGTVAEGVNSSGEIVGTYGDADGNSFGFVDKGGAITTLKYPGAQSTYLYGVNDSGQIVGTYITPQDKSGSFIFNDGQFTTIASASFPNLVATAISSSGEIAGFYTDQGGIEHGFTDIGGTFASFDVPNGSSLEPRGVNSSGDISGFYYTQNGVPHGFSRVGGTYSNVDYPQGSSAAFGINDLGQIVGNTNDPDPDDGLQVGFVATPTVCYAAGTLICTARGEVAVEELRVGDRAVTVAGAWRPVVWIGHRTIDCRSHPRPHEVEPVRVAARAFGEGLPARDLRLSPGHCVLVGADADGEDGDLVPIMCLVNGTTITREPVEAVTYWHIELDTHDILLAEGLPAESYLDWGDRAFFTEGADHALANPDFVVPGLAGRCRAVAMDGPVVEAERRRLDMVFAMRLAGACGWPDEAAMSFG